jgi:hypothetical protein
MKFTIPTRIAEIGYALVMLVFAALHLRYGIAKLPSIIPGNSTFWAYITGAGFLGAAVAIIINTYKKLACYLLALMLFIFILTVHLMPAINEHSYYQPLKDGALAMAAIIIGNSASK